jgi:hypothetical protein
MGSGGRWRILEGINQTVCTYAYIYIYIIKCLKKNYKKLKQGRLVGQNYRFQ